ncbi:MAG: hypothetical protein DRO08_01590 [Thermoprotei archaeon]|nr:MAG: hypothetical protein DRO08_01590 [Thermoprotei archaeon]
MLKVIIWKEIKETIRDRNMLSSALSVTLLMVMLNMTAFRQLIANLETFILYMAPCIGVLVGFSLSYRFTREKQEGTIETLLCTPLTLKELWLSKVIGLTIPSYVVTLATVTILILIRGHGIEETVAVYILLVIPMFIASAIGLLGYLQYVLGMKQVQMLNYVVFFTLFAILYAVVRKLSLETTTISWSNICLALMLPLIILTTTYYLVARLSKEKIILTIN